MIDTKKIEKNTWKTIKERWGINEEDENQGLREKAFKDWKTRFLSSRLHNFSLLHINNRYKYNNQMGKYKKDSDNIAVSNKCTFCKLVDQNTTHHTYLPKLLQQCQGTKRNS